MSNHTDDICSAVNRLPEESNQPLAPPIALSAVHICDDTQQARSILEGELPGYVYQRDGHLNADLLANKCKQLHNASNAMITASGMSAMAVALLSLVKSGEHVIVSDQLYGRSLQLLGEETTRLGIPSDLLDTCNLDAVRAAMRPETRLIIAEIISNPVLRVADVAALADIAHQANAKLLIDNTFATPYHCRPMDLGADLALESVSKMINGHSDVMMGLLCGTDEVWERVPYVTSVWGLASAPFDAWLALRGLSTLHLRAERASSNAMIAARLLDQAHDKVRNVDYPGLRSHPDHALATDQLTGGFGAMVTFHLAGGRPAAHAFMAAASEIPFCPSLGDVGTTLSHPESTSHRGLSPNERARLGIQGGTIRLSIGTESESFIRNAIQQGLAGVN